MSCYIAMDRLESNLTVTQNYPSHLPYNGLNGLFTNTESCGQNINQYYHPHSRTLGKISEFEQKPFINEGNSDGIKETLRPNHASQLLRAAANVVSNNNIKSSSGLLPVESVLPLVMEQQCMKQELSPAVTVSSKVPLGANSTSVSYTSKVVMSAELSSPASLSSFTSSTASLAILGTDSRVDKAPDHSFGNSKVVLVPFLWTRTCESGAVKYTSPSGKQLDSLSEVKKYLLSNDSCKCGLQCPFHVEKIFNFDPAYISKPWKLTDIDQSTERARLPCCHRKHIRSLALAIDCKSSSRPTIKPSPAKRRVRPHSSKGAANSNSSQTSVVLPDSEKLNDLGQSGESLPQLSSMCLSSPLPPVETVASHLRRSMPMELAPPFSPSTIHPMLQSGIPSPSHEHAVPPYNMPHQSPQSLQQPPQGYLLKHMYPKQRPYHDPGMFMPMGQSGYYAPQMPLSAPVNPQGPYHSQPGYDYVHNRPQPWISPPHMMLNPASQVIPPIWQARPETPQNSYPSQKRKRHVSEKSTNSETSGLLSPHQQKSIEKVDSSAVSKPQANTMIALPPEGLTSQNGTSVTAQSDDAKNPELMNIEADKESQNKKVLVHTTNYAVPHHKQLINSIDPYPDNAGNKNVPSQMTRTPVHPGHPFMMQNGYPSGHMTEAMYYTRQPLPPNYRPANPAMVYQSQYYHHAHPMPHFVQHMMPRAATSPSAQPAAETFVKQERSRTSTDNDALSTVARDDVKQESNESNKESVNDVQKSCGDNMMNVQYHQNFMPMHPINGLRVDVPNTVMHNPMYPARDLRGPHQQPYSIMHAPNGQVFYRYPEPHYQHHPQMYSYHQPLYPNMPYNYLHNQPMSPSSSPKRKRKKTSNKCAIESHSAVLVGTDVERPIDNGSKLKEENNGPAPSIDNEKGGSVSNSLIPASAMQAKS